jgi:hypothetical protein
VTITTVIRNWVFIAVFATAKPISAQDVMTSTAGDTEEQAETPPEFTPSTGEPLLQTAPDTGTLRAGAGLAAPEFILGRRMKLSASVVGGYDDNVNLSPTGSPSWFANPSVVGAYQFGKPQFAMDLTGGAGITYYFEHPGGRNYDPNLYLQLFLAYRATERLTLDLAAFASYQAQPDVTSSLSANRRLGNFFRSRVNISAHYRWTPRFSTVTSYTFSTILYPNSSASSLNSSASSLDRLENQLGEEVRYLLFPTTTVTAHYRFQITDYLSKSSNQNSASNPITQSLAAGLDQTFSPHLTGIFRGGVQLRSAQTSPYAEVALHYVFDPKRTKSESSTFVVWTNRYSIEESDVAAGSGRETFRTNLLLNYGITARVSANLAVSYQHATGNSVGNGVAGGGEDLFDISPGVRYAITRKLSVNVGYRHTELSRGSASSIALQSLGYTRNRYFAGLNISF